MPCYDPIGNDVSIVPTEEFKKLKSELDTRTAQLCAVMLLLETNSPDIYKKLPTNLLEWHIEHKKFDMSKLT